MRVAVVCPYDLGLPGGVQQLTIELVDRLVRAGHEAWLVGPGERPGARSLGRTLRVRANRSIVPLAVSPVVFGRVAEAVEDADVVHVHEPLMPVVSWAALRVGTPRVATFHAAAPKWVVAGYRAASRWLIGPMASSLLTAVSPTAAAALPASWGRVQIIPNAIDVGSYVTGEGRSPLRVTFLGRDEPRKGLDVLLAAWPAVRSKVPDAELVVIGATRQAELPGVDFAGRLDEEAKRATLSSAAIHVAPNLGGESFGIVLAEAMAAGGVIVASGLSAFHDVVGDAGVFVAPGDAAGLSAAIVGLLQDPARCEQLRRAALERVQVFDWSHVVDAYLGAYARALDLTG